MINIFNINNNQYLQCNKQFRITNTSRQMSPKSAATSVNKLNCLSIMAQNLINHTKCNQDLNEKTQTNLKHKSEKIDNMPSSTFPKIQIPIVAQLLTRMKILTQQFVEKEQKHMLAQTEELDTISQEEWSEMEIKIMPITHVLKMMELCTKDLIAQETENKIQNLKKEIQAYITIHKLKQDLIQESHKNIELQQEYKDRNAAIIRLAGKTLRYNLNNITRKNMPKIKRRHINNTQPPIMNNININYYHNNWLNN